MLTEVLNRMAHEYADDDPHASEYAGKGSPNDSDSDEGLCVETNADVTKLLTTRGSRNSNEPMNESNRLESLVEMGLDVLALRPKDAAEPVTQKIQETHLADGSSSKCPLEVEDGNRQTSMNTKNSS